jgi:hypothetical protein
MKRRKIGSFDEVLGSKEMFLVVGSAEAIAMTEW